MYLGHKSASLTLTETVLVVEIVLSISKSKEGILSGLSKTAATSLAKPKID